MCVDLGRLHIWAEMYGPALIKGCVRSGAITSKGINIGRRMSLSWMYAQESPSLACQRQLYFDRGESYMLDLIPDSARRLATSSACDVLHSCLDDLDIHLNRIRG